jgi:hypothetical protein
VVNLEGRGLLTLRIACGLCALSLLYYTFRHVDFARVGGSLQTIGLFGAVLILLPQVLALALECIGWSYAFCALGKPVQARVLLRVRVASEAVAQTLPLGVVWAESLKPFLLGRHASVGTSDSVAAIVARKYLLMSSQAVYVALLAAAGFGTLRRLSRAICGSPNWAGSAFGVSGLLCLLALGLAGAFAHGRIAERVLTSLRGLPSVRLQRALDRRESTFSGADTIAAGYFRAPFLRTTLIPGAFFLGAWLCEALETFVILHLLAVKLDFFAIASVEIMLSFSKSVLFVLPAGIGVQDLGYVFCLSALGVPDALNVGAAFSVLKRAKELCWAALGYLLLALESRSVMPRASARLAARFL